MNKFYQLVEGIISKYNIKDGVVGIEWRIGGITGGSCWGDKADRPVDGEPEPEFENLDVILAEICPNISFLQYKRLCQSIIKIGERSSYEYYGNYYDYATKSFAIADLEKYLKDNNLWNEDAP